MNQTSVLVLALGLFACLMPAAIYCLVLAYVNNRRKPLAAAGNWDCVGLLLGLSGFLLVGGTILVAKIDSMLTARWPESSAAFILVWVAYFLGTILFCAVLIVRRRKVTLIYQIEPDTVVELFVEAARRVGLDARAEVDGVLLFSQQSSELGELGEVSHSQGRVWVGIELFRATRHATLNWPTDAGRTRREVEAELDKILQDISMPPNPFAGWLMSFSAVLSFMMLFLVAFIFLNLFGGP